MSKAITVQGFFDHLGRYYNTTFFKGSHLKMFKDANFVQRPVFHFSLLLFLSLQ